MAAPIPPPYASVFLTPSLPHRYNQKKNKLRQHAPPVDAGSGRAGYLHSSIL
jgi:hypothetical protein